MTNSKYPYSTALTSLFYIFVCIYILPKKDQFWFLLMFITASAEEKKTQHRSKNCQTSKTVSGVTNRWQIKAFYKTNFFCKIFCRNCYFYLIHDNWRTGIFSKVGKYWVENCMFWRLSWMNKLAMSLMHVNSIGKVGRIKLCLLQNVKQEQGKFKET